MHWGFFSGPTLQSQNSGLRFHLSSRRGRIASIEPGFTKGLGPRKKGSRALPAGLLLRPASLNCSPHETIEPRDTYRQVVIINRGKSTVPQRAAFGTGNDQGVSHHGVGY